MRGYAHLAVYTDLDHILSILAATCRMVPNDIFLLTLRAKMNVGREVKRISETSSDMLSLMKAQRLTSFATANLSWS